MKFLKPLLKKANSRRTFGSQTTGAKPTSFAEKRSMQQQQSLQKAQQERQTLLKKEYASPEPLNKLYEQKGNRLDVRIRNLKDKVR